MHDLVFLSIKTSLLMPLQHVERWQAYNMHSESEQMNKGLVFSLGPIFPLPII